MRTITLLAVSILLTVSVAKAQDRRSLTANVTTSRYNTNEPISFTERGIEFFVFQNGDFDFNTRPNDSQGDYFFRSAGKKGSNATSARGNGNYGTLIEHDSFGRVRRVGNTFINYDSQDRVSRIGTVYMRYNRALLTQIGGLQIVYNRRGDIVDMVGSVKGRNLSGFTSTYYGTASNYNNYENNYSYNDNDYYYYRADGTKVKIDEDKKEERK